MNSKEPVVLQQSLWGLWNEGHWIAITTNGTITRHNKLVMGRGCALEAKERFDGIDRLLADYVRLEGNLPAILEEYRIITFPVKTNYMDAADLRLIEASWNIIVNELLNKNSKVKAPLYCPLPGCGWGHRSWDAVWPVLKPRYDPELVKFVTFPEEVKVPEMDISAEFEKGLAAGGSIRG